MSVLLLVVTCLGTGVAIRLLRRWPRLVFVATGVGTAVLMVTLATAPSSPIDLLGRTLSLDLPERVFLTPAIGIAAALALFGPLTFQEAGSAPSVILSNSQGAFFFWSLAPFIVAMSLDSFPLAAFCWAIGLMILMLVAQPAREGRAGGAAQFLLLTVIATASLLMSNRYLDLYPLTPENVDLVRSAFLFLAWGLGLLLAIAPLHIWMGPLADEMPLLGMAFLLGVAQPVGLWLLFQLMSRMLWLTDKSPLLNMLIMAGVFSVPVGALLCISERRYGRFLAFASLLSLGDALIGFGLGTKLGLVSAVLIVLNRAVGIALLAGGIVFTRHHEERRWQMVGSAAMLCGGMALAGLPPFAGAPARWGIYQALAGTHPLLLVVLVTSSALVMVSVLRLARPVLVGLDEAVESTGEVKLVPYMATSVVIALLIVILAGGLFPHVFTDPLLSTLATAGYLK